LFLDSVHVFINFLFQVSKTFVAKTMKMIDKDGSGEVDVDEMVASLKASFFDLFALLKMRYAGFLFFTKC
jgi:hypothetical protein